MRMPPSPAGTRAGSHSEVMVTYSRFKALLIYLMWFATGASAHILSVEGPVPTGPGNAIFGAANVPHARLSIPLTPFGYVEEEYFVRGMAAAYRHTAAGPERLNPDIPYTTRIIVRRPADSRRFSGVVHFEPIHPTGGSTFHWLMLGRYLMSQGDIYVAAGLGDADSGWSGSPHYPNQAAPVGQGKVTKWFEPERYSPLQWPQEDGIRYAVMSEIGQKLRSPDADNPLRGLKVRAMLGGGWSFTGSLQRVFINEGFHERARLPDGRPVFDGYLIGVSSPWNKPGYIPLFNDEPFVPVGDARRILKQTDAKVIVFLSELEPLDQNGPASFPPDRDGPLGGYRLYELGGVIHLSSLFDAAVSYHREEPNLTQLIQHGYPPGELPFELPLDTCPEPQSDVPQGAFARAAVDNLRHWVLDGQAPPREKPLSWENGKLARDTVGNVLGGIRAAEFVVPIARYGVYRGAQENRCAGSPGFPFYVRDRLSREELIHRYGTPGQYIVRYEHAIDRLVAQRWLLPDDAMRLKAKARDSVAGGF